MSVQSQIDRIKGNIAGAYTAVSEKGGTVPETQDSANLAEAINSIPAGSAPGTPLDPKEVYKNTRPADWIPMPEPNDNEMYLLFHIPDGYSSLLAFTVTCTGSYTVALGTATDGAFVQQSATSVASGAKYEAELFADDYGHLTSDGFKQVMIKVSGTSILTWEPSAHSKKTSPTNFSQWNIVEIICKLPEGTKVSIGNASTNKSITAIRYFTLLGMNQIKNMSSMFSSCYCLIAIPELDTSKVTNMSYMFKVCSSLTAIPELDTSKVTKMTSMFYFCSSLTAIPELDTSSATDMSAMFQNCYSLTAIPELDTSSATDMSSMFQNCYSLTAIPGLDTSKVTKMTSMFYFCSSLTAIPELDTSSATNMGSTFQYCYSLTAIKLNPLANGWAGVGISLSDCSLSHKVLVDLFNSLPTITSAKTLTLTGNPGVSELTAGEKAIATNKNWTLTL